MEEDFGFMKRIEAQTSLLTLETDKQMVDDFKAAVAAFDTALKASSTNPNTAEVEAADAEVDRNWRTLTQLAKTLTQYPSDDVRAAAAEIYAIMKKYGDITGMAYNEEYGNLHNALQDLAALSAEKQKATLADVLITELQAGYEKFTAASEKRDAEEAKRQVGIVKQSRTACDAAYRTLVGRVNALVLVNGEASYSTFIAQVNVIVADAKATLSSRSTRNAKKSKAAAAQAASEQKQ